MSVCKTCGEKFHYCSSCGITGYKEYGYCSTDCMNNSKEFAEIERILNNINKEDRIKLCDIIYDQGGDMLNDVAYKILKEDFKQNKTR